MSEDLAMFAAGFLCGLFYVLMGVGVARTQKTFRLFTVCFWPIALGVLAYCGEISE